LRAAQVVVREKLDSSFIRVDVLVCIGGERRATRAGEPLYVSGGGEALAVIVERGD